MNTSLSTTFGFADPQLKMSKLNNSNPSFKNVDEGMALYSKLFTLFKVCNLI